MAVSQIAGDHTFAGTIKFNVAPTLPESAVGDREFDAGDPLTVAKQDHQHVCSDGQASGVAATAVTKVIHVAQGPGTVTAFNAGPIVAATGDSTVTVDLKKNGTTVLTGTITLDNGDAAYSKVAGAIASSGVEDYVAGDVFTVVQTVTAGTGTLPQGVFWQATFDEGAS